MRTKWIKYKIVHFSPGGGWVPFPVEGYAINCPGMQICVRLMKTGMWRCDDYKTGTKFGGHYNTCQEAIYFGIHMMRGNIESGRYARAVAAWADRLRGEEKRRTV